MWRRTSCIALAAEQGYARAQSNLGLMYDNGEGVPEDDLLADDPRSPPKRQVSKKRGES